MKNFSTQEEKWGGKFGNEYVKRNPPTGAEMNKLYKNIFGVTRTSLNKEFLDKLDRSTRILEVGANVGSQLNLLQKMGFTDLYGIDINRSALEQAKSTTKGISLMYASAFDIPFKDGFFDLVFTSGVLIHISPKDIKKIISEIYRVSNKYIWGFEYYAPKYTEVNYRGNDDMLWKTDFAKLYMDEFPLKLIEEKKVKYRANENADQMFLLQKKKK